MDPLVIAVIGCAAMMGLILLHVPIGISMALVGVVGFKAIRFSCWTMSPGPAFA